MSARGMRSPKLMHRARGTRVATAMAGLLAILGMLHPSAIEARTQKGQKLPSKTRTLQKAPAQSAQHPKKRLKRQRNAKRGRGKSEAAVARSAPTRNPGKSTRRLAQGKQTPQIATRAATPAAQSSARATAPQAARQGVARKSDKTAKGTAPKQVAVLDSKRRPRSPHRRSVCRHCRGARPKRQAPIHLASRPRDPSKLVIPEGDGPPTLNVAARLLGRPYRFGADQGAFDCSGFVRTVFATVGIELPHSAREQFTFGDRVTRDDLEPGDLVFFGTARRRHATHVGIYVGEDKFVHAATRAGQVQVDSLNESYYARHYIGARRLEI